MTAEIFSILRLQPVLGTFFTKENNKQGADKVIVLTRSYWETQYQESPEIFRPEHPRRRVWTHLASTLLLRRQLRSVAALAGRQKPTHSTGTDPWVPDRHVRDIGT